MPFGRWNMRVNSPGHACQTPWSMCKCQYSVLQEGLKARHQALLAALEDMDKWLGMGEGHIVLSDI